MAPKLNIPPSMLRRAVRRLDQIANDPASPTHSATTAARSLLARAPKDEAEDDDKPKTRPALLLLPSNDRDRAIDDATRARILAGEFVTVVPLHNDREPDHVRKNDELVAAITATLDAAYPDDEAGADATGSDAAQLADAERRRRARDRQRASRANRAAASRLLPAPTVEAQ
jgi:hypothetical protein